MEDLNFWLGFTDLLMWLCCSIMFQWLLSINNIELLGVIFIHLSAHNSESITEILGDTFCQYNFYFTILYWLESYILLLVSFVLV